MSNKRKFELTDGGRKATPEVIRDWLTQDLQNAMNTMHLILSEPEVMDFVVSFFARRMQTVEKAREDLKAQEHAN